MLHISVALFRQKLRTLMPENQNQIDFLISQVFLLNVDNSSHSLTLLLLIGNNWSSFRAPELISIDKEGEFLGM